MAASQRHTGFEVKDAGVVQVEEREAPQNKKMAIHTHGRLIPSLGDAKFRKPVITEIIEKKFEYYTKDILDVHGILYGTSSAVSGLLANFIFRNSFKVQHEALKSLAIFTTLPFLSTVISYKLFVTDALRSDYEINVQLSKVCISDYIFNGIMFFRLKMENHKQSTIKEDSIFDIISRKIKQLPEPERNLLEHGSVFVGLNAAFSGLIANSLYRRILHVTQARLASSIPMAMMPFLTASMTYGGFVSLPLSRGDLNCEACAMSRGALTGFVMGGVYPILFALSVNGGLAARVHKFKYALLLELQ
ncbi:hypothetical protein STEG23_035316 [Scotinomys teguina]